MVSFFVFAAGLGGFFHVCSRLGALRPPCLPVEQSLPQGAKFVSKTQNDRLPAPGQTGQVQGPHMAVDHVPFFLVEGEEPVSIFQGPARMVKAVPLVVAILLMPIVEIQIMQKCSPHQSGLVRS